MNFLLRRPILPRSANDVSARKLIALPDRIRHADDGRVDDVGVREQDAFEFGRGDLEASYFDQFL